MLSNKVSLLSKVSALKSKSIKKYPDLVPVMISVLVYRVAVVILNYILYFLSFKWSVFVHWCCDLGQYFTLPWLFLIDPFFLSLCISVDVCFIVPLTCSCQTLLLSSFQSLHLHLFWWMTLRYFCQRQQVKCVCPFVLEEEY